MNLSSRSPLRWVPSLYFAMGLPFVVLEHGFCGSVQGPGDLGCSDRVLDLSDHVAMDDQVSVEPFFWALPDEEVLGRGEPVVERRSVRRRGPVASPSAVLLGQCCCLCGRCVQRGYARHRGRQRLHVGSYRLRPRRNTSAGRGGFLQPCETGRHGRSGVACGVALRGFRPTARLLTTPLWVRGRSFCCSCASRSSLWAFTISARFLQAVRLQKAARCGMACRACARLSRRSSPNGISGIISPSSSCTGWARLRDEDRFSVSQSRHGIQAVWGFRTSRSAFTTDFRRRGVSAGLAFGGLLHRPTRSAAHSFHAVLYLQPAVRGLRLACMVPAFEHVARRRGHRRGVLRLRLRLRGPHAVYDAAGRSGASPDGALRFRFGYYEPLGDAHGHGFGLLSDLMSYRIFFLAVMLATIPAFVITRLVPFTYDDKPNDK